jgi:hypothetical protein
MPPKGSKYSNESKGKPIHKQASQEFTPIGRESSMVDIRPTPMDREKNKQLRQQELDLRKQMSEKK